MFKFRSVSMTVLMGLLASLSTAVLAQGPGFGPRAYEVTITNITAGQILSPAVAVIHHPTMEPLFELGAPASPELAGVAEDALLMPLVDLLSAEGSAYDVGVTEGGPILPGASATVVLRPSWRGAGLRISLAGMLVTTNDAFYGLDAASVPLGYSSQVSGTHLVPAYDAGSEYNSELCAEIPGPPCGNGGVRNTDMAEGFVHIHRGIHGVGDLDPADWDWNNPVAKISIRPIR